jgi:hypothetical protein
VEVKPYTRTKTVMKTIEVKEEVPYIGIHLTPGEAKDLYNWLSANIGGVPTGMNRLPRTLVNSLRAELYE